MFAHYSGTPYNFPVCLFLTILIPPGKSTGFPVSSFLSYYWLYLGACPPLPIKSYIIIKIKAQKSAFICINKSQLLKTSLKEHLSVKKVKEKSMIITKLNLKNNVATITKNKSQVLTSKLMGSKISQQNAQRSISRHIPRISQHDFLANQEVLP